VILPDHLHSDWRLPDGDSDFSLRWRLIKHYVAAGMPAPTNRRGEKLVWQRRFWEHAIRDEDDWRRHVDYVHYNPVKHGYVSRPEDWPWSSFAAGTAARLVCVGMGALGAGESHRLGVRIGPLGWNRCACSTLHMRGRLLACLSAI
jgi:hypothetical protein